MRRRGGEHPDRAGAVWTVPARLAGGLAGLGVLALVGCLSAFAPAVRVRGPHAGVRETDAPADCLACHELESEALARMTAANGAQAEAAHSAAHEVASAPLVADWMVEEAPRCTDCHTLRGHR